jgi:hypothetical protein
MILENATNRIIAQALLKPQVANPVYFLRKSDFGNKKKGQAKTKIPKGKKSIHTLVPQD